MSTSAFELYWPDPALGFLDPNWVESCRAKLACPICTSFWPRLYRDPLNITLESCESYAVDRGAEIIVPGPAQIWRTNLVDELELVAKGYLIGKVIERESALANYCSVLAPESVCRRVRFDKVIQSRPPCKHCGRSKSIDDRRFGIHMDSAELDRTVFSNEYGVRLYVTECALTSLSPTTRQQVDISREISIRD